MAVRWDPGTPALLPAIVCFADILGFRAKTECALESGKEEDFLLRIKRSLEKAYDLVRRDRTLDGTVDSLFDMKVFTDNIVVAYPLRDVHFELGEPELGTLLMLFAEVQASLASDGFLMRGAITFGYHYQDVDIAYGEALLEAVDLEKSCGPPRLVIGSSVEPLIVAQLAAYGVDGWAPHHVELVEDPQDGRLFVNYLEVATFGDFPEVPINFECLAKHRKHVCRGLADNKSNSHVRSKYEWAATYHNFVCRTLADRYSLQHDEWVDDEHPAFGAEAQRALDYLVPDVTCPPECTPRLLDARRLCQRLGVIWPIERV